MHSILQDWPDAKCRGILQSITLAMKQNAHWLSTGIDIIMSATFRWSERTAGQWRALAESVGLTVAGTWEYEREAGGLIEMDLS